jgi:hypothetical protein
MLLLPLQCRAPVSQAVCVGGDFIRRDISGLTGLVVTAALVTAPRGLAPRPLDHPGDFPQAAAGPG